MYDGAAGADAAAHAAAATHPDANALLQVAVEGGTAASEALKTIEPQARQELQAFFARTDWRQALAAVFTAKAGTDAWNQAADALKQAVEGDTLNLRVEIRSAGELNGAYGAFAAKGETGEPTVYLNGDWLASAPSKDGLAVLLEEIGHSFDAKLNGDADTPGDEGELFAHVASNDLTTSEVIDTALDNDALALTIDGQDITAEAAAPSDSGWITIGRTSDPDKGSTDGSWTAAAPDIVSSSTYPYLQYLLTSSNTVLNVKFRLEKAPPKDLEVDYGQILVDLNSDGIPEFGLFLHVVQKNGYSQSADVNSTTGLVLNNTSVYTYQVYFVPLDKSSSTDNTRPNNTTFDSQDMFLIYDSGTNKSAQGTSGSTATGNHYSANVGIYFALAPETDLDGDGITENYYIMSFNTQAYADFATYANALSGKQPLPVTSWPTTGTPGGNPVLYGAAVSATQQNSVNGDIGGGAYTGSETWRTIFGINDLPVPKDNTYTTLEDTLLTGRNIIRDADPSAGTDSDTETATSSLTIASVTIGATTTAFSSLTDGTGGFAGYKVLGLTNGTGYLKSDGTFQYMPSSNANGTALDSFTYKINDGTSDSTTSATVKINVTAVNDAPVANTDTATAVEAGGTNNGTAGTNPTGNVITNDTDADSGDTRTVTKAAKSGGSTTSVSTNTGVTGQYGTLTISSTGAYTYTVDNSNSAVQALRLTSNTLTDTFVYTIADAAGATSSSTLTVTIQGANDNPVAVDDYNVAKETDTTIPVTGYSATGNALTNDTDVDSGDSKSIVGLTATATGTNPTSQQLVFTSAPSNVKVGYYAYKGGQALVDSNNNKLQITALANSNKTITLSGTPTATLSVGDTVDFYLKSDGSGSSGSSTVTTINSISGASATVSITPGSGTIAIGMSVTGTGVAASTTVSSVTYDSSGNVNGVTLSQTTTSGLNGTSLTFSASAGTTVTGRYGTFVLNSNGSYTYTPTSNNPDISEGDVVSDTFKYSMQDTAAAVASTANVVIEVYGSGSNDPVVATDTATAVEAGGVSNGTAGTDPTGNVLSNDSTPSGTNTVYSARTNSTSTETTVGTNTTITGQYGTLTISTDGSYTYTVDNSNTTVQALRTSSNTLTDTFLYTVRNGLTNGSSVPLSNASSLTVTIQGANDNPVANADVASATEAGGVSNGTSGFNPSGNVLTNDADVDSGDGKTVKSAAKNGSSETAVSTNSTFTGLYGTLTISSDGSYSYAVDNSNSTVQALAAGGSLTDVFSYTMQDTALATSSSTLTITINGANDAPTAKNNTYTATEDTLLTSKNVITDTDGTAGQDSDPETATASLTVATVNGITFSSLTASTDSTGHPSGSGWKQVTLSNGTLYIKSDGSTEYMPNANSNTADTFTYSVSDGSLTSTEATVTINVTPVNDAPSISATPSSGTVYESSMSTGTDASSPYELYDGYFTVSDPDGTTDIASITFKNTGTTDKTLTVGNGAGQYANLAAMVGATFTTSNGSVKLTSYDSGTFGYEYTLTSAASNNGTTSTNAFTVQVTDSGSLSATATVTMTIVDDAPTLSALTFSAGDTMTVDETNLATDATANFGTDFTGARNYGADGAGSTSYSLVLGGTNVASGLYAIDSSVGNGKGAQIVMNQAGNVITGSATVNSVTSNYFTITVNTSTGVVTFDQLKAIWHASTSNPDDTSTLTTANANDILIRATVTDGDGSSTTGDINLGTAGAFKVKDDGPTAVLATPATAASITLDETNLTGASISSTADFKTQFSTASTVYGTDGAGSIAYALNLTGSNVASGLYALDASDTTAGDGDGIGQGSQIVLNKVGNDIVGTVGATEYVRLSVNGSTGVVTFTQSKNLWHSNTASSDEAASLTLAAGTLTLAQTVTDADGDASSVSYDLGANSSFKVKDDGPTAATATPSITVTVTVDETNLNGGSVSSTGDFSGYFSSASTVYGTDGPGSIRYALALSGSNVNSGLYALDAADTITTDGDGVGQGSQIVLNKAGNDIVGTVGGTEYLRASVNATSGVVTYTQSQSLYRDPVTANQALSLTLNAGALVLTQTVKDADGDSSSATYDLGANGSLKSGGGPAPTVNSITVNEASPYAVFTVTGQAGQLVKLELGNTATTSDVDATLGTDTSNAGNGVPLQYYNGTAWVDYTPDSLVAIPAGGTTMRVRTAIVNDTTYEGPETFTLTAKNAGGLGNTGTGTIVDDGTGVVYDPNGDPTSSTPDDDRPVSVNSITVNEASPYAVFTVTGNSGQKLKLELGNTATTSDVDATLGTDTGTALQYYDGTNWVDYTPGSYVAMPGGTMLVRNTIKQDTVYEGPETYTLVATNTGGTSGAGVGTIVDDGTGVLYPDDPKGGPTPDTTSTPDDDRPVSVNSITVNEASPYAVFTVTGNSGQKLKLELGNTATTSDVDATLGTDTGTALQYYDGTNWVDYTPGSYVTMPGATMLVRTTIKQDTVYEGPETFTLTVTNTGGTSGAGVGTITDDGTGALYPDNTKGTTDDTTVKDDDRPVTVDSITINEASPYAVFTVTGNASQLVKLDLGKPSDTATVGVDTSNAGNGVPLQYFDGTSWVDYAPGSYVAIPASGTTLLVRTAIVNDGVYEGPESFTLTATNTGGKSADGHATLIDDGTGIVYDASGKPTTQTPDDDRPKPLPPVAPVIPAPAPVITAPPPPLPPQQPFIPTDVVIQQSAPPPDPPSLTVASRIPDQYAEPNAEAKFAVPEGTFVHTNPGEHLSLAAQMADGTPLPSWLHFNGTTGVFEGKPPRGFEGEMQIKVIARDSTGNEVESMFRFEIGDKNARRGATPAQAAVQPGGEQQQGNGAPQPQQRGEQENAPEQQRGATQPDAQQRGERPSGDAPERQGRADDRDPAAAIAGAAKELQGRASLQQQLHDQALRLRMRAPAAKAHAVRAPTHKAG